VVDEIGCSIAQWCRCNTEWDDHADYVSCVVRIARSFVEEGVIRDADRDEIVTEAKQSSCGHRPDRDSDKDGVPDNKDDCPETPRTRVVDKFGCSLAQLCPCNHEWDDHADYVRCVVRITSLFVEDGLISDAVRDAAVTKAKQSSCPDRDNDGVPDNKDDCPKTPPSKVVDKFGCSFTQLCPCNHEWDDHADYVRCVVRITSLFVEDGLISDAVRDIVVTRAKESSCGKRR
jgi:hypothetical protein